MSIIFVFGTLFPHSPGSDLPLREKTLLVFRRNVALFSKVIKARELTVKAHVDHPRRAVTLLAEELKIGIACLVPRAEVGIQEVKGRCLTTGLPKSVKISSVELVEAIAEPARDILETIHMVLERTPPELVADVAQNGIIMAGGGSLIYGFDQLVEKDTGIRTTVVDDALSCAAFGSGKMLMNLNDMQDGMVNLARKRQMKA